MELTTVLQYQTRPEAAGENRRLVEQVFRQLAETAPEGLRYTAFQLADGAMFAHVVTTKDGADPLTSLDAFAEFQRGARGRMAAPPKRSGAAVLGSYASGSAGG